MYPLKKDQELVHEARRKRVTKLIKGQAALFSAAPVALASRDLEHAYRQNTDFHYLTGLPEQDCALVLLGSSRGPRSILFIRERNIAQEQWLGERLGVKRAKRLLSVDEVHEYSTLSTVLPRLLKQFRVLHYAPGSHPFTDELVWRFMRTTVGPQSEFPDTLLDSRLLTSEMRWVKDREEIRALEHAADISARAFVAFAGQLSTISSEVHAARVLEANFAKLGSPYVSFPTIVASGKNATYLHHSPQLQPLWKRELVLVDAGATYRGYAADISRTFPVAGKFTAPQRDVYEVVLAASEEAIKTARPGVTLEEVHNAAVRVITKGLMDLKILRGNKVQLITKKAYFPYFMHRIGHWIGLDVHDASPTIIPSVLPDKSVRMRSALRKMVPGNAFTVEPGLYFCADDETVPKHFRGIGIRIEDDVLITESGSTVLTLRVPKAADAIEAIVG